MKFGKKNTNKHSRMEPNTAERTPTSSLAGRENGTSVNGTNSNNVNNNNLESSPPSTHHIHVGQTSTDHSYHMKPDELAAYIQSKMKEQYMEQAKSLEQLQLKMQEQLLQKQAQLIEQLNSMNGANDTPLKESRSTELPPINSSTPTAVKPPETNNKTADFSNAAMTASYSTEDSAAGSNMSQGSSVDTWDSSNAFNHERPVLTGSERSTPTPVQSYLNSSAAGMVGADDELLSQSVHIPIDGVERGPDGIEDEPSRPTQPAIQQNGDNQLQDSDSEVDDLMSTGLTVITPDRVTPRAVRDTSNTSRDQATPRSVIGQGDQTTPRSVIGQGDQTTPRSVVGQGDQTTPRSVIGQLDQATPRSMIGMRDQAIGTTSDQKPETSILSQTQVGNEVEQKDMLADRKVDVESEANSLSNGDLEAQALAAGGDDGSDSTPPPETPGADLSASLRLSLREKHSRHLSDLRAYYEQELKDLNDRLSSNLYITQHDQYLRLEAETQRLRERCRVLEEELLRANRYINTVDKQMEDLEKSFTATLNNSRDTELVDSLQQEVRQKDSKIETLEKRNRELFTALCDAYEVRDNTARAATRETEVCLELRQKYDSLFQSHQNTLEKLESAEQSLRDSRSEISELRQSVYKLEQHQTQAGSDTQNTYNSLPHNTHSGEIDENRPLSPLLKAERQLRTSYNDNFTNTPTRPSHYSNGTSRHRSKISPSVKQTSVSADRSAERSAGERSADQQRLSDTQSSEDSRHENVTHKHRHKHRHRSSHVDVTTAPHAEHLISAYSPIVDRDRHSSGASSGPNHIHTSPNRVSTDRPYGYHHVGAAQSSPKRLQQWTLLTPSSSNKKPEQSVLSAKKDLTKMLETDHPPSPQSKSEPKLSYQKDNSSKHKTAGTQLISKHKTPNSAVGKYTSPKKSTVQEEKTKLIKDSQTRLDELLLEKTQLESALTRVSSSGRQERQRQESLERRLDRVDKDLGSVRMTLRRYNCL